MNDKPIVNGKYLMYRGKPLVREKNVICYGNMSDKYVLFMAIMSVKNVRGMSIPDRVLHIQITSAKEYKNIIDPNSFP